MDLRLIPVGDEQLAGVKTCEDCTEWLTCKKATVNSETNKLCDKFVDNFPELDEIEEEDLVDEPEADIKMYRCNGFTEGICNGCPHAIPHDPEELFDNECIQTRVCEDVGKETKCEEIVYENEDFSRVLD